jgi:hypothetical protein
MAMLAMPTKNKKVSYNQYNITTVPAPTSREAWPSVGYGCHSGAIMLSLKLCFLSSADFAIVKASARENADTSFDAVADAVVGADALFGIADGVASVVAVFEQHSAMKTNPEARTDADAAVDAVPDVDANAEAIAEAMVEANAKTEAKVIAETDTKVSAAANAKVEAISTPSLSLMSGKIEAIINWQLSHPTISDGADVLDNATINRN